MLKVYQIITSLLAPVIKLYLLWRRTKGKEDIARMGERFGKASVARRAGQLIWIHAASVGEALSVLPLIELLGNKLPQASFLLTTGTVTSAKLIARSLPPRTIHQYIPVDVLAYVRRFLEHFQPNLALWVESEIWPNLITQTSKQCPLIMINGRMSAGSFQKWQKYGQFIGELLRCFALCLAQSKADMTRFQALGAPNVKYIGNIKYAALPLKADATKLAELTAIIKTRPVWVAASTHKNEEQMIAAAHVKLKLQFPELLTIIIPRHPARAIDIFNEIVTTGLQIKTRAKFELPDAATDIYLADTMGELGIFYRLTDIVFIGGSLVEHGGQNPLEPARLGCAILAGQHMFNFAEIMDEFIKRNAIITVAGSEDLALQVASLLEDKQKTAILIDNAYKIVHDNNGILEQFINEIITYAA